MTRQEILNQLEEKLGGVPHWMEELSDPLFEQYWGILSWILSDTGLSIRDKALIGFGAAAAIHCEHMISVHAAQMLRHGMTYEHVKEASWMVQSVVGASAFLHGISYSAEQFKRDVRILPADQKKTGK